MTNNQWAIGTRLILTNPLPFFIARGASIPSGTECTVCEYPLQHVRLVDRTWVKFDEPLNGVITPYYMAVANELLAVVNTPPSCAQNNTGITYTYVNPKIGMKVEAYLGAGRWVTGEIIDVDADIYGFIWIRPDHDHLIKYQYPKGNQGSTWKAIVGSDIEQTIASKLDTKSDKDRIWEAVQAAGKR
jgi:hypothetical protein